jgi:ketosteroid isomerase-like protein
VSPSGAELRSMQNRLSWVLCATDDGWRIVHEHTSAPAAGHDGTVILTRPAQQ